MKQTTPARAALLYVFVLFAIVLVACGGVATTKSTAAPTKASKTVTIKGLKQRGVLTVGLRGSASVPLVVEQKGSMTGLDVELARSLADELGLTASFRVVEDVEVALNSTCDIVMSAPADNKAAYEVVGHYADTATAFFHRGNVGVASIDDISNKTVAVEDGSSAQQSLLFTNLAVKESTCKTLSDAFERLAAGEADYVLCHSMTGAYLTLRHEGTAFAGTLSEPVANGIAVADKNSEVLSAVKEAYESLQKNGALAEAQHSWLGTMPTLSKDSRVANVPLKETSGVSLEELSSGAETLSAKMDGSSAGANAVTLDGSRSSRRSSSSDTADSSNDTGSAGSSNTPGSYDEDYDPDVSYASQQSQGASSTQYDEDSYSYQSSGQSYGNESYSGQAYADQSYVERTYSEQSYDEQTNAGQSYSDQTYVDQTYDDQTYNDSQYTEPQYSEPQYTEPQYTEPQYSEPQYSEQYSDAPSYDYDSSAGYDSAGSYQDLSQSASYEGYASNYGDGYADYGTNNYVTE